MKVVIIGLGSIANKHIKALVDIDEHVCIYALRHREPSKNIEGIENIYSVDEIININPDFIIISNPTIAHFKTIKNLIDIIDTPLFIEKPLFSQVNEETKSLVDLITEKKIITYVACNLRFHNGINKMKELIKGKRIEEVNSYCGSYLPNWRPNVNFRDIYSANKEMGGGVHIDLIHELDYIHWFFGKPKDTKKTFKNKSSLEISSYDYANYIWEYDNFCASIILNYYRKDTKRTLEILTDEGTYILDLIKNNITFDNQLIFNSQQTIQQMYDNQMLFFINQIKNKENKFNTVKEAYKILELCF